MATATDDVKSGMRTSELCMAVGCIAVIVFQDKLGIVLSQTVENILAAGPLMYIGGRNMTKIAAILSAYFGVKIPPSLANGDKPNAS